MTRRGTVWNLTVVALGLCGVLWLESGCSRKEENPAEDGSSNRPSPTVVTNGWPDSPFPVAASNFSLSTTASPPVSSNTTSATEANPAPDQARLLTQLKANYAAAGSFDDRFDVVLKIAEARSGDSVRLLEELFRQEKDKDLRVELINGLMGLASCKEERLTFLKLGLAREQPAEVREAAIDGLVDLEDQRALDLVRGLSNDPDPAIAKLARDSAALMEKMLQ